MKESKRTARTVVIVVILCLLVIGYYAYLSNKQVKKHENRKLTEKEELLLYDMDKDYPHSPRDVVQLYSRMMTCVYNDKLNEKDLGKMVDQMRLLYADEFADDSVNTRENQIANLKKELEKYSDNDKILNFVLSEVSQVEYKTVKDRKCAMVDALYTVKYKDKLEKTSESYVLVQDSNEKWKILGWKQTESSSENKK